jgi:hypothetical protein
MRANIVTGLITSAVDTLWKIEISTAAYRFFESQIQSHKHDAKTGASRVNQVDDLSPTPSRQNWQQKNFRG